MSTSLSRVVLASLAIALAAPVPIEAQSILERARRAVQDVRDDVDDLANDLSITRQNLEHLRDVPCETADVACPETVKQSPTFNPQLYQSVGVVAVDQSGAMREPGALASLLDYTEGEVLYRGYSTVSLGNMDEVQAVLSAGDGAPDADRLSEISEFVEGVPGLFVVSVMSSTMKICQPASPQRGTRYWEPTVRLSARLISMDVGEVVWLAQKTSTTCHAGERDEALMAVLEDGANSVVSSLPSLLEP